MNSSSEAVLIMAGPHPGPIANNKQQGVKNFSLAIVCFYASWFTRM